MALGVVATVLACGTALFLLSPRAPQPTPVVTKVNPPFQVKDPPPVPPPVVRTNVPLTPAQERALRPRDTFKECDTCPDMIVVPAGGFHHGVARTANPAGTRMKARSSA